MLEVVSLRHVISLLDAGGSLTEILLLPVSKYKPIHGALGEKIFLLFYMCDFAVGLTHCYKTTVFLQYGGRLYFETGSSKPMMIRRRVRPVVK